MPLRHDQLDPDEEVIAGFYRHPIVHVKSFFIFLATWLLFFGLFFMAMFLQTIWVGFGPITIAIALVGLFFGHHILFILLIEYFSSKLILTNKRLIHARFMPFFEDDVRHLDLSEMHKFEKKKQGILKNLLNYGDIVSDVSGPVVLDDIPYPAQLITLIKAIKAKKDLHELRLKRLGVIPARKYKFLVKG